MQYLGVIAFLLCIVHFVYQTILLPSYRQTARDKLFVLRDELRREQIEIQDTANKATIRAFKEVDEGINRAINRLHLLTFSNLVKLAVKRKENPEENRDALRRFHSLLDNSEVDTPRRVIENSEKVLTGVICANSFMFLLYLLPIVLVVKLVGVTYRKIKNTVDYMSEICIVSKQSTMYEPA